MFDSTLKAFAYVLYLCTQSDMTCDKQTEAVKTVAGIAHYVYAFGALPTCQAKAEELSKAKPLAYNQWYECRKEKAANDY
jgi:hypothetical protein